MLQFVSLCLLGACWGSNFPVRSEHFQNRATKVLSSPIRPRIVNGEPATPSDFPYIVSLKYGSTDELWIGGHFCGGSLITDPYGDKPIVLTAAHCLDTYDDDIESFEQSVFMEGSIVTGALFADIGRTKVTNTMYKGQEQVYDSVRVDYVVIHPNYNATTDENDVAVLQLSQAVDSDLADAAMITWDIDPQLQSGEWLQVSGYGINKTNGTSTPTLQFANQTYINTSTCDKYFYLLLAGITTDWANPDFSLVPDNVTSGYIYDDMICGAAVTKDSCQGDSGGPFIRPGAASDGSNDVLVGVVSWGIGCAAGTPGVYAYVNYFRNWINNCIDFSEGDTDKWEDCAGSGVDLPEYDDDDDDNNHASHFNSYIAIISIFVIYAIFG